MVAVAGVSAGVGILTRPNSAVLLIPFVLLARRSRAGTSGAQHHRIRAGLALVAAVVLVVAPWEIRDLLTMHHLIPLTNQTGLTAAGTYNDTTANDNRHPAAWRPPNLVPQYASLLRGDEVHQDRKLRAAAIDFAVHHPGYDLRVLTWNTLRTFDLTGPSVARASWVANGLGRTAANVISLGFLLVGALAVGGLFTRRARQAPFEVWLAPIVLLLVTVPLLGEARLRLPLEPFVVLLAAVAIGAVMDRKERRRARFVIESAFLARESSFEEISRGRTWPVLKEDLRERIGPGSTR
jgi:hypothetical protein